MLGVGIDAVTLPELMEWLRSAAASGRAQLLLNHNLHSIALHHGDPTMRSCYARADLIVADGRPLVRWARFLGRPLSDQHKLSWLDHLDDLLGLAVREGWTVAHLGGRPGIGETAAERLRNRHPGLRIFTHHGYFTCPGPEADAVMEWIRQARPQLLFIGMGMPRQEQWLAAERHRLPPCVAITSGATFDFRAGAIPTPPRWLSPLGLEWLFRLLSEPRRLGHRYLIEPLALLPWMLKDWRTAIAGNTFRAEASGRAGVRPVADHATAAPGSASSPPASASRR